jgi:hypothetical protein
MCLDDISGNRRDSEVRLVDGRVEPRTENCTIIQRMVRYNVANPQCPSAVATDSKAHSDNLALGLASTVKQGHTRWSRAGIHPARR